MPYKGGQAALPDILSGRIDFAIMDVVSMTPLVQSGRLKALAITGPQRSPALPQVPTVSEAGIAFDTVGWHAVFGPAGMAPAQVERLHGALVRAMAAPEMRTLIVQGGSIPIEPPLSPTQWARQFADDVRTWGRIAHESGARID